MFKKRYEERWTNFGLNLKNWRESMNVDQETFAAMIVEHCIKLGAIVEISGEHIGRWERAEREPKKEKLEAVLSFIQMTKDRELMFTDIITPYTFKKTG